MKGGLSSKQQGLGDEKGRPLDFLLSPGQMADSRGALVLFHHLLTARHFLEDSLLCPLAARWPETTWHPAPQEAQNPVSYNQRLYRRRYRIENAFGHLHDWRGIATLNQRFSDIFPHAIILTAIVIFRI